MGKKGILPVPLILRDYQDELEEIRNLDELLDLWWEKAETEAQDKQKFTGAALDITRLKQSYSKEGDHIPLLLFDGIDEVGGLKMRYKIVQLAQTALLAGHSIVLTGRPSGYDGINLHHNKVFGIVRHPLYHAQPFAWPQIQQFVKKFYLLHDEWKVERQRGVKDINQALQSRQYLLTLARRPIFLTLMALVHINDRRMPHGRADLYRRIIDLYLIRQTHQRRLKFTVQNTRMPHWEEQEVRRGLGYLAWLSQHRGEAAEKNKAQQDKRQVIWSRQEISTAMQQLLKGETEQPYHGRFRDITPDQADELLRYYLNPAGLLVEPAEEQIQFAHLSFQEYLCAEYIHGRALAGGSRRFLDSIEERLYRNLHLPGWDEVGLLLLTIHANQGAQTEPTAHLELLAELDPSVEAQAKLLITALTGKELDYLEEELLRWLPVAVATVLIHPKKHEFIEPLGEVPAWAGTDELGLKLLKKLFSAKNQVDALWDILLDALQKKPPAVLEFEQQNKLFESMKKTMHASWQNLHKKPEGGMDDQGQTGFESLLFLAVRSGWIRPDIEQPEHNPMADREMQQILADWLKKQQPILYRRNNEFLPEPTAICWTLDALVPNQGDLWQTYLSKTLLDSWLLQGVSCNWLVHSNHPSVLLSLYPVESLPENIRLAMGIYQSLQLTNKEFTQQLTNFTHNVKNGNSYLQLRSQFRSRSLLRSLSRSQLRSQLRSPSWSQVLAQLQVLAENAHFSSHLQQLLKKVAEKLSQSLILALEQFGYSYAIYDWFQEQAESPELMQRRGLRPGQPLPPKLKLFDNKGLLRSPLSRQALVNLQEWLQDDQQILDWVFPEGLSKEWQENLLEQMAILWKQPWSPRHAVQATLDYWPEDLLERETTLAAIEQPLIDALLAAEAEDDNKRLFRNLRGSTSYLLP
ncbi:MAG: hypothetical protein D3923_05540 [Candidatus Electrothrix sp. AR3]|nr:hypothetical protein [Candidatus Electrothrix sp. AR3]